MSEQSGLGGIVVRSALLARIARQNPRVVALIAPAGYGKSTLARQLSARSDPGVCDCAAASSVADIGRNILRALVRIHPERASFFVQSELQASLAGQSADDIAVQAWRRSLRPDVMILENGESLLRVDGAVGFLLKLLAVTPSERLVIICTRERLPITFSRFVRADEIAVLYADDLHFSETEFRELAGCAQSSASILKKAFEVSRGWPIVAAFMTPFLREGRLDELLSRLDDVAFDELQHYITQEALGALPKRLLDALIAASLIPEATSDDIACVLGVNAAEALRLYAHGSPFVSVDGDRFELHPLIRATLWQQYQARRPRLLRKAAREHAVGLSFVRAAELQLALGDQEAAACSLDRAPWLETPTPATPVARIVASLDRSVMLRHPKVWSIAIAFSRFSVDPVSAVGEARLLLQRLDGSSTLEERMCVVRPLAGYLSRLGMHEEGYRLICELERDLAIPPAPRTVGEAATLYIRMMIAGRMGRTHEALDLSDRVRLFALDHDGMAPLYLTELASETLRAAGRRDEERSCLDEAIERAFSGGYHINGALALAEAAFGAWLAGEDTFNAYAARLEGCVQNEGARGFWFFVAVARGLPDMPPIGLELPKWIACAQILAAVASQDAASAQLHAAAAREAADKFGSPFLRAITALIEAELVPGTRTEGLTAAFEIAHAVESPALLAGIRAHMIGESETGMLRPLIARLRREMKDRTLATDFRILSSELVVDGVHAPLSDRKFGLLATLARSRHGLPREALLERVWPEHEADSAVNAFNLCLHQLRKRFGNETIVLQGGRYALGESIRVDLWQIEDYYAALSLRRNLEDGHRAVLRSFYETLCRPLPDRYEACGWFDAIERRIAELRCEICQRLASDALLNGRTQEALSLAQSIIRYDACDEPAREIVIRAYIQAGDEASAFREYRRYREILWEELQAVTTLRIDSFFAGPQVEKVL